MKSIVIAVVGLAVVNAKTQKLQYKEEAQRFDNQKKLMEIKEEGTYFQEDSDKPKDEDSMWWWNGWYKFIVDVYYGFEMSMSEIN